MARTRRAQSIDLGGKVAAITGAGSGIGRATAILLARHGAKVHAADIRVETAQDVVREIEASGGSAAAHELDVSDPAAVEAFAAKLFEAEGAIDILHNNAGIGHGANIEATTIDDWQRVIGVNLLGVAYGMQAFVPRMLEQGRPASVINTASQLGLMPAAKTAPYCASKYGIVGLSEALNAELAHRGIHVSAICPGVIDTAIVSTATMRGDLEEKHEQVTAFYAKRGVPPEEVAEIVLRTIAKPALIVPAPRRQVLPFYLLHRLSPRLVQPIARHMDKLVGRG
jgi:NAD(P)-dependent dehydrogenase (short-subunit alcohol dehydrogenase family)